MGGSAVMLAADRLGHYFPRSTRDIDLCIAPSNGLDVNLSRRIIEQSGLR
jgi:hypothetical protein